MSLLRYFITSKAKRNLLRLFFSNAGSAFYTREIARLTGEPLNAVRRELGYLEKAGLLHSYMQGNLKYYAVVKEFPVLAEWRKIILETPDVESVVEAEEATLQASETGEPGLILEGSLNNVIEKSEAPWRPPEVQQVIAKSETKEQSPNLTLSHVIDCLKAQLKDVNSINLAIVHGEAVMSEDVPKEGVDIMVVGDINNDSLLQLLAHIEDDTGIRLNLVRMTRSDFDYRNAHGDPFIRRIWGKKKIAVKGRH